MVGRCIPYWNGHFLGDMLVFRGVTLQPMSLFYSGPQFTWRSTFRDSDPNFHNPKNVVVAWSGSKKEVEVIGSFPHNPFEKYLHSMVEVDFQKICQIGSFFPVTSRVKKSNMLKNQHRPSSCWLFHSDIFWRRFAPKKFFAKKTLLSHLWSWGSCSNKKVSSTTKNNMQQKCLL